MRVKLIQYIEGDEGDEELISNDTVIILPRNVPPSIRDQFDKNKVAVEKEPEIALFYLAEDSEYFNIDILTKLAGYFFFLNYSYDLIDSLYAIDRDFTRKYFYNQ